MKIASALLLTMRSHACLVAWGPALWLVARQQVAASGCRFRLWSHSATSPQGVQGPPGPKGDAGAFGLKGEKVSDLSPQGWARLRLHDLPGIEEKFLLEAGSRL